MSGESRDMWVGPSRCDDAKVSREERLKKAWQTIVSSGRFADMYLVKCMERYVRATLLGTLNIV